MKRYISLLLLVLTQLAFAESKQKILFLDSLNREPYTSVRTFITKELEKNRYISGKNIELKVVNAENKLGLATRLLETELEDDDYDVIVVNGTIAGIAAQRKWLNNPKYKFVFCSVTDPVGVGLIERLNAKSSTNFTGVAYHILVEDRLQFLVDAIPSAKTIGVIYADMPQAVSYVSWLKESLKEKRFKSLKFEFRKVPFVAGDNGHIRMIELSKQHVVELNSKVDAYLAPSDQLGVSKEYVKLFSKNSKLPFMALTEKQVNSTPGAHLGAYISHKKYGKQVADILMRVLRGENIGNITPLRPTAEYGINLKESKKINLSYPRSVMKKSNHF